MRSPPEIQHFQQVRKRYPAITVFCLYLPAWLTGAAAGIPINGIWQGKIHIDGADCRIVLRIDPGSKATIDSPDIGRFTPKSVKTDESLVGFELDDPKASFHGRITSDHGLESGSREMKSSPSC